MQRCCCTLVVLSGSSHSPPRRAVQSTQHRLVDDEALRSVGEAHAPAGRAHQPLESDGRGEPREEQPVGREHAPHLLEHAAEMRGIGREMQDGAADHGVHAVVFPRKVVELGHLEILRRQPRRKGRGECSNARDGGAFPIDAEAGEAVAEKVDQIASIARAGVHHSGAAVEAALQNLIEEVDVDLAELRPEIRARSQLHVSTREGSWPPSGSAHHTLGP